MKIPWLVTLVYIILISLLSHQPSDGLPDNSLEFENIDKLFHFIEFSILGFLVYGSLSSQIDDYNQIFSLSIKVGILISFLDEYHQSFVQGRDSSLFDLIFDILGVLFGNFFHYKLFR